MNFTILTVLFLSALNATATIPPPPGGPLVPGVPAPPVASKPAAPAVPATSAPTKTKPLPPTKTKDEDMVGFLNIKLKLGPFKLSSLAGGRAIFPSTDGGAGGPAAVASGRVTPAATTPNAAPAATSGNVAAPATTGSAPASVDSKSVEAIKAEVRASQQEAVAEKKRRPWLEKIKHLVRYDGQLDPFELEAALIYQAKKVEIAANPQLAKTNKIKGQKTAWSPELRTRIHAWNLERLTRQAQFDRKIKDENNQDAAAVAKPEGLPSPSLAGAANVQAAGANASAATADKQAKDKKDKKDKGNKDKKPEPQRRRTA